MEKAPKELYRYADWSAGEGAVGVELQVFPIVRLTPCGCWIDVDGTLAWGSKHGRLKWVSLSGKKRYAYPTRKEAEVSFRRRKAMQVAILRTRLAHAEKARHIDLPLQPGHRIHGHTPLGGLVL